MGAQVQQASRRKDPPYAGSAGNGRLFPSRSGRREAGSGAFPKQSAILHLCTPLRICCGMKQKNLPPAGRGRSGDLDSLRKACCWALAPKPPPLLTFHLSLPQLLLHTREKPSPGEQTHVKGRSTGHIWRTSSSRDQRCAKDAHTSSADRRERHDMLLGNQSLFYGQVLRVVTILHQPLQRYPDLPATQLLLR